MGLKTVCKKVSKGMRAMARPIQATPKLNKEQTVCFVNRLWEEQDDKEIISLSDSVRDVREKRDAAKNSTEK